MQSDELMSLKETGQKGDFLLPYEVSKTIMPDYYNAKAPHLSNVFLTFFLSEKSIAHGAKIR